jgi:membrane fusion protein (multidrug efflux system)
MRYLVVIVALILLIGGLAGVKVAQIKTLIAFGETMAKAGPPPESVNTASAVTQKWGGTLETVGSVISVKGVALGNDSAGVVSGLHFESGARVKQGQVLLELDASVEKAQLASLQARLALAKQSLARSQALAPSGAIPAAQLETDQSTLSGLIADVGATQAQIDRKIVRAPFSGRLGIRLVNLGQYLAPGTTSTVLESTESVFVDFLLPQTDLGQVGVGTPVLALADGATKAPVPGTITAVDPSLNADTRSLRLRATLNNREDDLKPGMFVRIRVILPDEKPVVVVPGTAVVHAPYGDSVFVVEPKKSEAGTAPAGTPALIARQQFVRVGAARGDFMAILAGVNEGEQVVSAGAFKLRNGAPVAVKNEVNTTPELDPHPADH